MPGHLVEVGSHLGSADVFRQIGGQCQGGFVDALGERAPNAFLNRIGALLRDDGGDGVLLLVRVVHHVGVLSAVGQVRHHVLAEVIWDNDGCIVGAVGYAVHSLLFIDEHPVEAVVASQLGDYRVAHVHAHWDELALVACVFVCNGHLQVARVAIGVPAAGDVEPSIKRRGDDEQHDDHDADDALEAEPHVGEENVTCSATISLRLFGNVGFVCG